MSSNPITATKILVKGMEVEVLCLHFPRGRLVRRRTEAGVAKRRIGRGI